MQGTKFSVRSPAVIIIDAIGDVAALLNLADDAARADRVHRPRLDEVGVPRLHGNKVEQLFHRAVFYFFQKFFLRGIPRKAAVNPRALVRLENIPHLRLAVIPFHAPRVFVVGVYLNG